MRRRIVAFHLDEHGDWVASLECRHRQHVRHQSPFREAAWVLDGVARMSRIGTPLDCPLCDRAELPDGVEVVRTTDRWTTTTRPRAVRKDHRIASGSWGPLRVFAGSLRFQAATSPPIDHTLLADDEQPIPPDVTHHVEPLEDVECSVSFLR